MIAGLIAAVACLQSWASVTQSCLVSTAQVLTHGRATRVDQLQDTVIVYAAAAEPERLRASLMLSSNPSTSK